MNIKLIYILLFSVLISCAQKPKHTAMLALNKHTEDNNLTPDAKILNKVFQDEKKRDIIYRTPFGGIIFKAFNGKNYVYKVLDIRKDTTEDNKAMYVFKLHIIANNEADFKSFFEYKYNEDLYEDVYIRYSDQEELAEKYGELSGEPNAEVFVVQYNQYTGKKDEGKKENVNTFWNDVLNTTDFNKNTISNLTDIDNLENDEAFKIQKLYWGYGRRKKSDKLYDCINLQNLSIWEENANYLTEDIQKLENLNVLALSYLHRVRAKTIHQIHKLKYLVSLSLNSINLVENKTSNLFNLPKNLSKLSQLKYLSVSANELTNFTEISKLKHLKTLNISFNKFSNLDGIENLTSLEELNINNNLFTELPEGIKQLKNLKTLIIGANAISSIPDWIGDLTNLEKLIINDTNINTLPESIGNLKQLDELYIWHNNFKSLPKSLQNLKEGVVQLEYKKRALYDDTVAEALKDFKDGVCTFKNDFGLKLMVINQLMYYQETLKPKFDVYEFVKTYKIRTIDIEKEGYEPIPEVVEYFKNLEIPKSLLLDIEELSPDGGDYIYGQIFPFWGGTTDDFDVKNVDDLKHLPRLKKIRMMLIEPQLEAQIKAKGIAIYPY